MISPVYQVYLTLNIHTSGAVVKNLSANAGDARDMGLVPGSARSPGVGKWQPTPVFLPGKSHGERSLVGYSPQGCKESETTKHTHTYAYTHQNIIIIMRIFQQASNQNKQRSHQKQYLDRMIF